MRETEKQAREIVLEFQFQNGTIMSNWGGIQQMAKKIFQFQNGTIMR